MCVLGDETIWIELTSTLYDKEGPPEFPALPLSETAPMSRCEKTCTSMIVASASASRTTYRPGIGCGHKPHGPVGGLETNMPSVVRVKLTAYCDRSRYMNVLPARN